MTKRTYRRPAASSDSYAARRLGFLFVRLVPDSDTVSFTVVLCRGCGLLFSNPRLNPEEMAAKYGYLADLLDDSERAAEPTLRAEERSIRIYRDVSRSMGGPPVGLRVLDYGGAQGYNLLSFQRDNRCFLADYVEHEPAPGVEYLGKDLHDLDPGAPFDIVLLCHVLEHATRPVEMLSGLAPFITGEGILFLEVPLGAFRDWRAFKEPLTHVNFFSEQSLGRCLAEAGLSARLVSTDFQWVTRYRAWCINAVGCPSRSVVPAVRLHSTRRQMCDPVYYTRWGIDRTVEKVRARFQD